MTCLPWTFCQWVRNCFSFGWFPWRKWLLFSCLQGDWFPFSIYFCFSWDDCCYECGIWVWSWCCIFHFWKAMDGSDSSSPSSKIHWRRTCWQEVGNYSAGTLFANIDPYTLTITFIRYNIQYPYINIFTHTMPTCSQPHQWTSTSGQRVVHLSTMQDVLWRGGGWRENEWCRESVLSLLITLMASRQEGSSLHCWNV